MATGRNSTRLSSWLVGLEWSAGKQAIEFYLLPRAAVNKPTQIGNPWEPTALNYLRQASSGFNEAAKPDQAELALRFTHYDQGYDYSLLFFDGYVDDLIILQQENNTFFSDYQRYQAYGIQWAAGLGKSTLRAEFAYKTNFPLATKEHVLSRTKLSQLIVGWDRNFSDNRYINLQFFYDHFSNNSANDNYGLTYSVSDKYWNEDLQLGIRGLWNINTNEVLAEIFADYRYNDQWTAKAGYYCIDGDQNTLLQDYHRNQFFYLQLNYQFGL